MAINPGEETVHFKKKWRLHWAETEQASTWRGTDSDPASHLLGDMGPSWSPAYHPLVSLACELLRGNGGLFQGTSDTIKHSSPLDSLSNSKNASINN